MRKRSAILSLCFALASGVASAAGPVNLPIDLTVPAPPEPITDSVVFGESRIFAPNFAINQNDPALADLFDPTTGSSNLCFPTSLAENLIYLLTYHTPAFGNLRLGGLSADLRAIDPNTLVRQLYSVCRTSRTEGTDSFSAIGCTLEMLSRSGYGAGNTKLISPFNRDPALPIETRPVALRDIREALKAGDPVLLEFAWFKFDPVKREWVHVNGHYVGAYGYDYNPSWGENQLQVKVINPESNYGSSRKGPLFDTITIERVVQQPGITYPENRPFIVSGPGFGALTMRGFLGMMIRVSPTEAK